MFTQLVVCVLLTFSAVNASYLPLRRDATGTPHANVSGSTLCAEVSQVNPRLPT